MTKNQVLFFCNTPTPFTLDGSNSVVVLFGVTPVTTIADNNELLIEYSRITSTKNPSF